MSSARVYLDALCNEVAYDGVSPVSWRVSAYVLAVRGGRVLMVEPEWARRWELPGGEVYPAETLLEGAVRECFEETGYRFEPTEPSPYYTGEEYFYLPSPSAYHHSVLFVFRGRADGSADPDWRSDPAEVRRVGWIDPASLTPENTHPVQWPALRRAGLV